MIEQLHLFDTLWETYKIKKPIALIELFSGYGSQHLALEHLGANFYSHRICEWAIKSIQAYKDLHCPNDNTDYSAPISKEQLIDYLYQKGISANYNEPMTRNQIADLKESEIRTIYNNIVATKNLVSVCNVHAQDLDITDKEHLEYVMTYSFPCQDLSLAGKTAGMKKGSGTRSGLLWEVERILLELKERDQLPQILLLENVPQIHCDTNWVEFNAWKKSLADMGYSNFWQDLEATDFGVPQTRERTFMVSILGDYNYNFPQTQPLTVSLDDLLENEIEDKSYYLTEKQIDAIQKWKAQQDPFKDIEIPKTVCPTITARGAGEYHSGMILINESLVRTKPKTLKVSKDYFTPHNLAQCKIRTLTTRESFRLMGVRDDEFDRVAKNQTRRSLYHLAGDSIVVNVLEAIFKQLL